MDGSVRSRAVEMGNERLLIVPAVEVSGEL